MTVRQMIAHLSAISPDAEVVLSGSDHSYYRVTRVGSCKAETDSNGDYLGEPARSVREDRLVDVAVIS